jgi:uracil phosphoribosyltransferase
MIRLHTLKLREGGQESSQMLTALQLGWAEGNKTEIDTWRGHGRRRQISLCKIAVLEILRQYNVHNRIKVMELIVCFNIIN